MAPAHSKPSETAKRFIIKVNTKKGRVAGIKIPNDEVKAMLRKATTSYQAMVNKNLKEAEANRVACAIIQAGLDGEVNARTAIPIVGRGNGRDTTDKDFYKGDGSIDGTAGLYLQDGVFTCSEKMYKRANEMVAKFIGTKLVGLKADDSDTEEVPVVVHAPKKTADVADTANTTGAISVGSTEDTDIAQTSLKGIGIEEKARLFDIFIDARSKGK